MSAKDNAQPTLTEIKRQFIELGRLLARFYPTLDPADIATDAAQQGPEDEQDRAKALFHADAEQQVENVPDDVEYVDRSDDPVQAKIAELTAEAERAWASSRKQQGENQRLQADFDAAIEQLKREKETIGLLRRWSSNKKTEQDRLRAELENAKGAIAQLQDLVNDNEDGWTKLVEEKDRLHKDLQGAKVIISEQAKYNEDLRFELRERDVKIQQLKDASDPDIDSLIAEHHEAMDKLYASNTRLLKDRNLAVGVIAQALPNTGMGGTAHHAANCAVAMIEEKSRQLQQLYDEGTQLRNELQEKTATIAQLNSEWELAKRNLQQLRDQKDSLQQQADAAVADLMGQSEELRKEHNAAIAAIKRSLPVPDDATVLEAAEAAAAKVERLFEQMSQLKRERESVRAALASSERQGKAEVRQQSATLDKIRDFARALDRDNGLTSTAAIADRLETILREDG